MTPQRFASGRFGGVARLPGHQVGRMISNLFGGGLSQEQRDSAPWYSSLRTSLVPERGTAALSYTRATTSTFKNSDGRMVTAPAGCAVMEGARWVRNYVPASEAATGWTTTRAGTSVATAPSGYTAALKLIEDTSINTHLIGVVSGPPIGAVVQVRFVAKAAERSWLMFSDGSGLKYRYVNLADGTTGTNVGTTGFASTALGDGWYLFSWQYVVSAVNMQVYLASADSTYNYQGIATYGAYYTGIQVIDLTAETDKTTIREYVSVGALDYRSAQNPLYLRLPGTASHNATTPSKASITAIVDEADLIWEGALTDYTTASYQTLWSLYQTGSSADKCGLFMENASSGKLVFIHVNGTTVTLVPSSVSAGLVDLQKYQLRAYWSKATGLTKFYKRSSGTAAWEQIGTDVASPVTSMNAGSRSLFVGTITDGTLGAAGAHSGAQFWSGNSESGGTLVADFNPHRDALTPTGTITSSTTGEVWTINGANSVVRSAAYHGLGIDGAKAYSTYLSDQHFASLPGTAGSYIYTPDSAAVSITGDIDIRIKVAATDWTPAATSRLVCKRDGSGTNFDWYLRTDGKLEFFNGTTISTSSAATGLTDGAVAWLRVTRQASAGELRFYTSDDNTTWTQLGTTLAIPNAALTDTAVSVFIGVYGDGSSPLAGRVWAAQIYNGIDGTLAASFDATNYAAGTVSSTTGETWLPVGNVQFVNQVAGAALPTTAAFDCVRLNGVSGTYVSTPDSVANSITGDIDIRVKCALADWTPAAANMLAAKYVAAGNQKAYALQVTTTSGRPAFTVSTTGVNDVSYTATVGTGFVDGSVGWLRVTRSATTGDVVFYTSYDGTTWTQLGTTQAGSAGAIFDSTAAVEIGAYNGGTLPMSGRIYQAQIYNTIGGTVPVVSFDASRYVGGSTLPGGAGETWTLNGTAVIHPINVPNRGYRSELAATNQWLQSNALTTAPNTNTCDTLTQNVIGPDGATSAWTATDSSAISTRVISQDITLTAAAWVMRCRVKKTTGAQASYPVMRFYTGTTIALATLDTTNGVATVWSAYTDFTMLAGITARCTSFNSSFWDFELSATGTAAVYTCQLLPVATTNATQSTGVPDVAAQGSAVVCHFSMELGTKATSYIATTTTAQTRNADQFYYTGALLGTLKSLAAVDFKREAGFTNQGIIASLDDGSATNAMLMYMDNATALYFQGQASGPQWSQAASNAYTPSTLSSVAFSAAANNIKMAKDGVAQAPDLTATVPVPTRLNIGCYSTGILQLNGYPGIIYGWVPLRSQSELGAVTK